MENDPLFHMKIIQNPLGPLQEVYRTEDDEGQAMIGETATPLVDMYEQSDALVIEADLPGILPGEVTVRLADNQVTIEGQRGRRGEAQDAGHYLRMERCFEDFRRIIHLPVAVDPKKAAAVYRQGVLILRFPKIEDRRKRTIKIEIK